MTIERTLVLIKPDAVRRGMIGEVLTRFERKGFLILAMKLIRVTEEFARAHYAEHEGKHFYEPLVQYLIAGPVVALVLEGKNGVRVVREMMGKTFGSDSPPGTIRGDFALSNRYNLVHGSDSPESAAAEIARFFAADEIVTHPPESLRWIYDMTGDEIV